MALFKQKIKYASQNYTEQMLPQTRKEVFFDVLKLHWKQFIGYGFLFLLFTLPFFGIGIVEDTNVFNVYGHMEDMTEEQIATALMLIRDLRVFFALLKIPAFIILGIAVAGFSRVIRQYAWEEVVFFKTDFITGVKTNGKQTVLLALLVGVVNLAVTYSYNTVSVTEDTLLAILWTVPLALFVLLGIPTFANAVVANSIYNNPFGTQLKISFVTYSKRSWQTLLALLCCAVPFVGQMIPNFICHIVGRLVSPILIPFVFLGWYLFALNGFDRVVNVKNYPQLVGKGTFSSKQEQ